MSDTTSFPVCPKVVSDREELLRRLEEPRRAGRRIVFTNGCYDILHPGHVDLLERAGAFGDLLVVGLNSDDSVRRLNKGAGRPFNTFAARAFVLAHLASVDFVVGFDEDTPLELIRAVRPHVLVKGGDWAPDKVVGREIVEADGGEVHCLPLLEGFSTTALALRIAELGRRGLM
ncbi:MAG TPA: D-glycero-beta-D-manno-heptose 1-phosphate adenylyltransferase [Candidatus Mailhella merdavium]|nr:D-glycero-beta-D-manno-heptose 1-phosphate adenylyltransferase [Candidatus Mailhella merdavium]